jgi:hypothetical protein
MSDVVTLPVVVTHGPVTRSLRQQVELAVADLVPAGRRGAVVALAGHEGATVTVATKVGDHWRLAGNVSRKWGGDVSGQVVVVGSW